MGSVGSSGTQGRGPGGIGGIGRCGATSCCKAALIGSVKGQMVGAAGGIDMAKGNGMGAAVIEAVTGWGTVGREDSAGFDNGAADRSSVARAAGML